MCAGSIYDHPGVAPHRYSRSSVGGAGVARRRPLIPNPSIPDPVLIPIPIHFPALIPVLMPFLVLPSSIFLSASIALFIALFLISIFASHPYFILNLSHIYPHLCSSFYSCLPPCPVPRLAFLPFMYGISHDLTAPRLLNCTLSPIPCFFF